MNQEELQISVVVPAFNEEESIPELVAWIDKVMNTNNFSYEVVVIDDGSTDDMWNVLEGLKGKFSHLRAIRFQRNYGKSAALHVGFQAVKGEVVITMDADLQDSPEEIPELYDMIANQGYDLISGWKKKRYDPLSKTIPTKLFNLATRKMSGIELNDFNCGLKAYKKQVVKSIEVFGEMHRYIPVLAKGAGFRKIGEKVVEHQARKYGVSKFGLDRFINGFLDLGTVVFLNRYGKKPMHLFGLLGILMFTIGFVFALFIGVDKLFFNKAGTLLAQRTSFFLALTSIVLGVMLFLTGYLAELINRNAAGRNTYLISEKINLPK